MGTKKKTTKKKTTTKPTKEEKFGGDDGIVDLNSQSGGTEAVNPNAEFFSFKEIGTRFIGEFVSTTITKGDEKAKKKQDRQDQTHHLCKDVNGSFFKLNGYFQLDAILGHAENKIVEGAKLEVLYYEDAEKRGANNAMKKFKVWVS